MNNTGPMGNKDVKLGIIFFLGENLGTREISSVIIVSFRDPDKCLFSVLTLTGYPINKRCSIFGF